MVSNVGYLCSVIDTGRSRSTSATWSKYPRKKAFYEGAFCEPLERENKTTASGRRIKSAFGFNRKSPGNFPPRGRAATKPVCDRTQARDWCDLLREACLPTMSRRRSDFQPASGCDGRMSGRLASEAEDRLGGRSARDWTLPHRLTDGNRRRVVMLNPVAQSPAPLSPRVVMKL
jgi:hypothetical protein